MGEGVSKIDFTTLLILLQHRVLQYFLLYIEQKLYGLLFFFFLYHFIDLWAEPMMVITYIVSVYY